MAFDEEFDIIREYKTWEEIPVSSLLFNSNTSQICYIAISKKEAISRINEMSLPKNTIAYEYKENIKLKDDEVIIAVEIDTTNMYDTTNLSELNNNNSENTPLIRTVKPINHLGYTNYIVVYRIIDNRAVKSLYKI